MTYVDTPALLAETVSVVTRSAWAAVDTEADSLHHYTEKLCLVQITVEQGDFIVDPLAGLDLAPLAQALEPKLLILHGADFDIRNIKRQALFTPELIFDTMIAAQILGYNGQGLADLAKRHSDVTLSKSGQKADWSERPLSEKLLTYAANDTHYLRAIQLKMEEELKAAGRYEWLTQSCERLVRSLNSPRAAETPFDNKWQIKGSGELSGRELAILKELWQWREKEAEKRDRPPFKVLNTEYLLDMTKWAFKNPGRDIGEWEKAPRNAKDTYRHALNDVIRSAMALPEARLVYPPREKNRHRWTERHTEQLTKLKTERQKIAADLGVHPSLLATNAVLETLIPAAPRDREKLDTLECLMPWQADIFGEAILKVLNA